MAGIDISCLLKAELPGLLSVAPGDRLEEVAYVVAEVDAAQDPADEDVGYAVEDRHAFRAVVPRPLGELVDLVARLASEQLGQVPRVGGYLMDGQHRRTLGDSERAVLDRQADEEAGRMDRTLGCESHEAAVALFTGDGRDDEHRVLELADEGLELFVLVGHQAARNDAGGGP